ncbi:MAG: hypothetical protein H0X46_06170 [Bacteroidetes bacterium]|nr:hypothetical protein [Bacteroidota bacterium]
MESEENLKEVLKGTISLELVQGKTLQEFCMSNFNNYDTDRYDAVAIRFYFGKEVVVTLYALDKSRQEGSNFYAGKMPVKKFKMNNLPVSDVLSLISQVNFTLSSGNYDIEDMEVINK